MEDHLGKGVPEYDKTCKLCKIEKEDLEHFLIKCPVLEGKRNKKIMKNKQEMTAEEIIIQILFKEKHYNEIGKMIRNMCGYRKHRRDKMKPQWEKGRRGRI